MDRNKPNKKGPVSKPGAGPQPKTTDGANVNAFKRLAERELRGGK
jgi:hypothetical protein